MRELTSKTIAWIVCLHVFIGGLYVCNKDYTEEKAEVSTALANNDPNIVYVYVPEYMIHLKMPKKEWSGQDEFILQKDYELYGTIVYLYLILPMIICFAVVVALTITYLEEL